MDRTEASALEDDFIPLARRYRDVFFAGLPWPNRVAFFRELIPRLDGVNFQFLLPATEDLRNPKLPIAECEWNIRMSFADRLTAARYSKIVLYLDSRLSRRESSVTFAERKAAVQRRLFDVASLGVAQIAIAGRAAIEPYFVPNREILLARDAREAAGLIRELLADPGRAEALGRAARERVLSGHFNAAAEFTVISAESYRSRAAFAERKATLGAVVKKTLGKAGWIFRTQGVRGVVRRAWQRASAWVRAEGSAK